MILQPYPTEPSLLMPLDWNGFELPELGGEEAILLPDNGRTVLRTFITLLSKSNQKGAPIEMAIAELNHYALKVHRFGTG